MSKWYLKLYLAGTSDADRIVGNVKAVFDRVAAGDYKLDLIDVLAAPEQATLDNIFATPTLVVAFPLPEKRLIGNFDDPEQVMVQLGFDKQGK